MAYEEQVLQLFDSYWFEYRIFSSTKPKPKPNFSAPAAKNPDLVKVHEILEPQKAAYKQLLPRTPSLISRSFSDQALSSKDSFHSSENGAAADSPKSVLVPKLQTILSGKEVEELSHPPPKNEAAYEGCDKRPISRSRRRRKGSSKSLSELEFEELKGFMDLGFVFSDEDKDSSLVSILPGLQRLGKSQECDDNNEPAVSRPYLSEAWEVLDHQKRKIHQDPLMNWKIPSFGNEMELKDHLRFWAHSVASAVR